MALSLYKRGRTYWLQGFPGGGKHRESTGTHDKKTALLVLQRRERELADPTHAAANQATVTSAASRLLSELQKSCKTSATLRFYTQKTGHVVRLLGDVRLSELDHARVLKFTEEREAEGAHTHSVHRELTVLRLLIKSATRAGEFSRDYKTVLPKYSAGYVPRTRFLSEDEVIAVCRQLEPGRAALLAFQVATSANMGEAFRAQRGDVTPAGVHVRGTKRETRNRTVPHMAHVWPLMSFVLAHADGEGVMLFRPWGNIRRDILAACRRASVCPGCQLSGHIRPCTPCLACRAAYVAPFSTNDLRRTAATWLVKRGVPLYLAAKVLGHANTNMLQKVYGQLDTADVGRLINERLHGTQSGHNADSGHT